MIASKKAFEENPEKVAKWLKLYMRGIGEMKANPGDSAKLLGAYYKEHGLTLERHSSGAGILSAADLRHEGAVGAICQEGRRPQPG